MSVSRKTLKVVHKALATLRKRVIDPGLIAAVAIEARLSVEAVGLLLREWIDSIDADAIERLTRDIRWHWSGSMTTIAPGNLPIIAAECILLGALVGIDHDVALSTRGRVLAVATEEALCDASPKMSKRLRLHTWRQLDEAKQQRLLQKQRVVAYGTADTIEWIAQRAGPKTTVIPHGPTLTVGVVSSVPTAERAEHIANDVLRWDQRGCRSLRLLVCVGDESDMNATAAICAEAFKKVARVLPAGGLDEGEACARYLDGLTSASLGDVIEGDDWRITTEYEPRAARDALGRTLRIVGVSHAVRVEPLLETLPAPVGLRLGEDVPFGSAQRPRFDRLHDGRHRLNELIGR